jgi:hypothetical protein
LVPNIFSPMTYFLFHESDTGVLRLLDRKYLENLIAEHSPSHISQSSTPYVSPSSLHTHSTPLIPSTPSPSAHSHTQSLPSLSDVTSPISFSRFEDIALDVLVHFMSLSVGCPLDLSRQHSWKDLRLSLLCPEVLVVLTGFFLFFTHSPSLSLSHSLTHSRYFKISIISNDTHTAIYPNILTLFDF